MIRPRRLLTVGHSYAVALNRRLPHELALAGKGRWEVTVAAPTFVRGDLRPIPLEHFDGEACRLAPVPLYFSSRPHVMFYGRALRRLLREEWNVVHCWEEPFVFCGAQVARWGGSARVIHYTFQNLAKRYPPPFNCIERYSVRRSAGWIAAGETVQQTLQGRSMYAGKPHRVIALGVDTTVFRPNRDTRVGTRRSLGWSENGPPVVGYLGRFVPEKGLCVLTAALDAQHTPWRALFLGGGKGEGELRAWASKHSENRVRVVTDVKHDRVASYLCAMDILAAPSQTTGHWREQFGRMLIEAMACGVAVVGSDSGEIPYVIADAGEVVGEADQEGWTKTIGTLLDNPARRSVMGSHGRERAESQFAWPIVARKHLAFFEEVLTGPLRQPHD